MNSARGAVSTDPFDDRLYVRGVVARVRVSGIVHAECDDHQMRLLRCHGVDRVHAVVRRRACRGEVAKRHAEIRTAR